MKNVILENPYASYENEAKKLGATHKRIFYVTVGFGYYGKEVNLFSTHFFNHEDKEVAYIIEDLKKLCGMTVLENPRVWGEKLKTHPDYTLVNYV